MMELPKEAQQILQALSRIKEAGHGELVVKVADKVVVSIEYRATRALLKGDR